MEASKIVLFVIAVIGFAIAVTALVLAILWRSKTDTNPSIPSILNSTIVTLRSVAPSDVTFVPNTEISYTIVQARQTSTTISASIVLACSSVLVTRTSGPITDLTFAFALPSAIVGSGTDGEVNFIGSGTTPGTASQGPLAILQSPLIVTGGGELDFTLHYTFGGGSVPANQQMQLNFQISYLFQVAG